MKIFLLFLPLLFFLSGCVQEKDSVQKGMQYLTSVYEDGSYDDPYLEYIYPDEALACPLENCKLTYRLMDAYFNLLFIKEEVAEHSILEEQIKYADTTLQSVLPLWEQGEISNTLYGKGKYALDTYCILGYINNDTKMAFVVEENLVGDNWMHDKYYTQDAWRNIADESWCVRLFLKNGRDAGNVVEKSIEDSYAFLEGDYAVIDKVVVAIHMLYILEDANMRDKDFLFFQDYIAQESKNFEDDILLQANVLEALSKTHYKDRTFLDGMAQYLKKKQAQDGGWYLRKDAQDEYGRVFTTFRAILALNAYEGK